VYCVVPSDLAPRLHEQLRRHFRDDPEVEVVVERRGRERRSPHDRRASRPEPPEQRAGRPPEQPVDRRRIRSLTGRRFGERRAVLIDAAAPDLPRKARPHAARLAFVERLEPADRQLEDLDTARLVARFQAGDRDVFAVLYLRYFDRVYSYARIVLGHGGEAEDAAQQVFIEALEWLDRYEHRGRPFRAWLFTVARNRTLNVLRAQGRLEVVDPRELERNGELATPDPDQVDALDWVSDRELHLFIDRLPLAQRQVLVLRYVLDLSFTETAEILDRSAHAVRKQHERALDSLRARLHAVGRAPTRPGRRMGIRVLRREAHVVRARRFSLL
jgi:RNA polymerase sigma-70 factor (ECF subfamily)